MHALLQMPREIVANLHGEQFCFNCVKFIDEDSNCCGCEISISCSSVGRKLWDTLRNVVFLLLLHVTLKYTTVSLYTALVSFPGPLFTLSSSTGILLAAVFHHICLRGCLPSLSNCLFCLQTYVLEYYRWFSWVMASLLEVKRCVFGVAVCKIQARKQSAASLLHVCPPEVGHLIDIRIYIWSFSYPSSSPPFLLESVIVVESLGVQVCTMYWWGYSSSLFLPHTIIGDIIINEAITMVTSNNTNSK